VTGSERFDEDQLALFDDVFLGDKPGEPLSNATMASVIDRMNEENEAAGRLRFRPIAAGASPTSRHRSGTTCSCVVSSVLSLAGSSQTWRSR
jgi:hypothetical protein